MGGRISVVVADIYMEDLEDEAIDTAPQDTRSSMWKQYIDNSFNVVKRDK